MLHDIKSFKILFLILPLSVRNSAIFLFFKCFLQYVKNLQGGWNIRTKRRAFLHEEEKKRNFLSMWKILGKKLFSGYAFFISVLFLLEKRSCPMESLYFHKKKDDIHVYGTRKKGKFNVGSYIVTHWISSCA